MLTVYDDPLPEPPQWFPPEVVYYEDWPEPIVRVNKTQPFDPDRPIPYIHSLDAHGILKIGWDRKMTSPPNWVDITPTKVAVEDDMDRHDERFWETRRRKLEDYHDFIVAQEEAERVYFASKDKSYYELMQLIDALELVITPDELEEEKRLEYTWEMVDFNRDWIDIQLIFKEPWNIDTNTEYDTLSVTFWGVHYFQSW